MSKNYKLLDTNRNSEYGFRSGQGNYLVIADFDPWTGKRLESSYEGACAWVEGNYPEIAELGQESIDKVIQEHYKKRRAMHKSSIVCDFLYETTCGYDKVMTRTAYIPIIRAYVFYPKNQEDFEPMDYCPFCRAKLPKRLDDKLTEILQKEYGLKSWKDYKKAPKEFHTDEWWKKRGL